MSFKEACRTAAELFALAVIFGAWPLAVGVLMP